MYVQHGLTSLWRKASRGLSYLLTQNTKCPSYWVLTQRGHIGLGRGHIGLGRGHIGLGRGHIGLGRGHIGLGRGHIGLGRGHIGLGISSLLIKSDFISRSRPRARMAIVSRSALKQSNVIYALTNSNGYMAQHTD